MCAHTILTSTLKDDSFAFLAKKIAITGTLVLTIFLREAISVHKESHVTDVNLVWVIHHTEQAGCEMQRRFGIVLKTWCYGFQLQLVKSHRDWIRKLNPEVCWFFWTQKIECLTSSSWFLKMRVKQVGTGAGKAVERSKNTCLDLSTGKQSNTEFTCLLLQHYQTITLT